MKPEPPSVKGSPLLGCTRDLQRDQLGTYAEAMATHGDMARFRVGPPGIGFSFDAVFAPEAARQVLAADSAHYIKDAPVIAEFTQFLGNGLLVSKGERWRRHRRIVQPLFTRRAVASDARTIAAAAADLVGWCEPDATGNDIAEAAPTLRDLLPSLGEHLKRRSLAPVRTPHWWPSPANRRAERIRKVVWALADTLIADRRRTGAGGDDLLRRLLDARDPDTGEGLSDDDVRDEVIIFLIAGHETTGSSLAFTLYLLGRHEEIQDRARREAIEAGDHDSAIDDVDRLPYTTQVINEAMRLYPPAHTVVRRAVEDTELAGYQVDKGRIVAVNIWGIHHRPTVWLEPFRFSPDRFEPAADSRRSRGASGYSHLPFGGGPRACIGEHLAMAELVAAVTAILRRYRLRSLLETPALEVDLALRPGGPMPCRFEPLGGAT